MERAISDLGAEIKQPSNPFANLSKRGIVRCQVNALFSMVPSLESESSVLEPRGSANLDNGYVLLRKMDRTARIVTGASLKAIEDFCHRQFGVNVPPKLQITRWARLRLPHGQIARSKWKEDLLSLLQMSGEHQGNIISVYHMSNTY